jgi:hypothetical protein
LLSSTPERGIAVASTRIGLRKVTHGVRAFLTMAVAAVLTVSMLPTATVSAAPN